MYHRCVREAFPGPQVSAPQPTEVAVKASLVGQAKLLVGRMSP